MKLEEIKAIREKQSLETIGMTTEEAAAYFKKGADELIQMMEELKQKNIDKVG